MKVLVIAAIITIVIFPVPFDNWLFAPEKAKKAVVQTVIDSFKVDNPSCREIKISFISEERSQKVLIIVECDEKIEF